ncbi:hypothetical protein E2562_012907 [Oryza meyeriana var. granulata]|uniref:DC1 domain-containing protein n=1 Tax=Oryza meyeriana var. granulata TaxID=110450 RepID=A0A6G1CH09_9ORYZ|nr:hypothetical protein E2562_012907 [Oryza meyeriana var. granulata]
MTKLFEDPPSSISHPDHPAHELKLVTSGGAPFRCDGCMQPGDGAVYRCDLCHFDLHMCCALPPATLEHDLRAARSCSSPSHRPPLAAGSATPAATEWKASSTTPTTPTSTSTPAARSCACRRFVQDGRLFELRKGTPRRCGMCGESGRRRDFWAYRTFYDDGQHVFLQ